MTATHPHPRKPMRELVQDVAVNFCADRPDYARMKEVLTELCAEAARRAVERYQTEYRGHTPYEHETEQWREYAVRAVMGETK